MTPKNVPCLLCRAFCNLVLEFKPSRYVVLYTTLNYLVWTIYYLELKFMWGAITRWIEVLFGQGGVFSDPDHLLLHLRVCDYWVTVWSEVEAAAMSSRVKQPSMTTLSPHSLGYLDCNDSVVARTSLWEVASKQLFLVNGRIWSSKLEAIYQAKNYQHQLIFNQLYPNPTHLRYVLTHDLPT